MSRREQWTRDFRQGTHLLDFRKNAEKRHQSLLIHLRARTFDDGSGIRDEYRVQQCDGNEPNLVDEGMGINGELTISEIHLLVLTFWTGILFDYQL